MSILWLNNNIKQLSTGFTLWKLWFWLVFRAELLLKYWVFAQSHIRAWYWYLLRNAPFVAMILKPCTLTILIMHSAKSYEGRRLMLPVSVFFRTSISATSSCWTWISYSTASYAADTAPLVSVHYTPSIQTNISISSSTVPNSRGVNIMLA